MIYSFTSDIVLVFIWMENLFMSLPYFHFKMRVWQENGGEKLELLLLSCTGIESSQYSVTGGIHYLKLEEKYSTPDIWHVKCSRNKSIVMKYCE